MLSLPGCLVMNLIFVFEITPLKKSIYKELLRVFTKIVTKVNTPDEECKIRFGASKPGSDE